MASTPDDSVVVQEKAGAGIDTSHIESLEKVDTFDIDLENKHAAKGDASDGKIDWTFRQIVATISLSMIYTGKTLQTRCPQSISKSNFNRLSDPPVFRRWLSHLH